MAGLFIILGIILGGCIVWVMRMKHVILNIWSMTPLERYRKLNVLVGRYGFYYDEEQDVFLSRGGCVSRYSRRRKNKKENRKRKGISCYDSIRYKKNRMKVNFSYGRQRYLLSISRKQKGIFLQIQIHFCLEGKHDSCYPVGNTQCLDMSLVLYEDGKRSMVLGQKGVHLTAQRPCCLCKPECMKLRMRIIFPDSNMALAFVNGMRKAGYQFVVLSQNCTWVVLDIFPQMEKEKGEWQLMPKLEYLVSRAFIYCYCTITKPFYKTVDRMLFLHEMLPFLFPLLFCGELELRQHSQEYGSDF